MRKYLIYALVDPRTQEIRYIGRSSSGLRRPNEHKFARSSGIIKGYCDRWALSLVKIGLEPLIKVIEECPDFIQKTEMINSWLNVREQDWISWYRREGARLTNLTRGGEGRLGAPVSEETREKIRKIRLGKKHTEESKKKMSLSAIGKPKKPVSEETRQKQRALALCRRHTEETKKKLSAMQKGKKRPCTSTKVRCIETGEVFESIKEAAKKHNTTPSRIWMVCTKRRRTTSRVRFEYISEPRKRGA